MFRLNEIAKKIHTKSENLSFDEVLKLVKKIKKEQNPPFEKDDKDKRVHLYPQSFLDCCLQEICPSKVTTVPQQKIASKQILFLEEIEANTVTYQNKKFISLYEIKNAFVKVYEKDFSLSLAKKAIESSNKTLKPVILKKDDTTSWYYRSGYASTILHLLAAKNILKL
jgi:hypothetical protein